jgi:hypothetical protein
MLERAPVLVHEAIYPVALLVAGRVVPPVTRSVHRELVALAENASRDAGVAIVSAPLVPLSDEPESRVPGLVGLLIAAHEDHATGGGPFTANGLASDRECAGELLQELWSAVSALCQREGVEAGEVEIYLGQAGGLAGASLVSGTLSRRPHDDDDDDDHEADPWLTALEAAHGADAVHVGTTMDWSDPVREAVIGRRVAQSSWLFTDPARAIDLSQVANESLYVLVEHHDG